MRLVEPVEVIAHRGASAYQPEHTFAAYELALAQGADTLELDVRPAADGTLLLVHDRTLLRTAGDPRRVADLDAVALTRLSAGVRPLRLDAALRRYGGRCRLLVELKEPGPAWELEATAAIARHGASRVVVQSFAPAALERLRRAVPELAVAPLYARGRLRRADLDAAARYAAGIGVEHRDVDADLVAAAHGRGLALRAWTVDEPAEMRRLVGAGVDGLITNVPDVAREVVAVPLARAA
jgi:glycerophosphoryl diester phosphodiesterase